MPENQLADLRRRLNDLRREIDEIGRREVPGDVGAIVGNAIDDATAGTPVDADKYGYWDTVNSLLKSITHVNLKALLKTYFDTLYGIKAGFRGARVTHNANQSIADSTFTVLAFNSESSPNYDTSNFHDTLTNNSRLTVSIAGQYLIIGQVAFAQNTGGLRGLQIRLNGTTIIASNFVAMPVSGSSTDAMVVTEYNLAASDYVELLAYQSSGGALNVAAASNYSPIFSISQRDTP